MMAAPARVGPDTELLDGGGAESIAGGEHHLFAASAKRRASLPMVVVLPEPFTPTTSSTNGLCARCRAAAATAAGSRDGVGERGDQLVDVVEFLARDLLAQLVEDVLRGFDAHVRRQQTRLELVEDFGVDLAARHQVREVVGKPRAGRLILARMRAKKPVLAGGSEDMA
jgi:hypothetical protein